MAIPKLVNSLKGRVLSATAAGTVGHSAALLEGRAVVAELLCIVLRRRSSRHHPAVCGTAKKDGLTRPSIFRTGRLLTPPGPHKLIAPPPFREAAQFFSQSPCWLLGTATARYGERTQQAEA